MENTPNQLQQNIFNQSPMQSLPNATAVLVLGIIAIVGACCYGVVGIICGIIALVLAKKDRMLYHATPGLYTESSYKNLNAGRICAIIGLSLSSIYLVIIVFYIAIIGTAVLSNPNIFSHLH